MAYVVTDACVKDLICADACPSDAIHPTKEEAAFSKVTQVYINPEDCMDCGACAATCPSNAIYAADELPADRVEFAAKNAEFFAS